MAYSPAAQQYVQNAVGAWIPVGYSAGATQMPAALRDPNTSRQHRISTFASLIAAPSAGLINTTFYTATSMADNYTVATTGSGSATSTAVDGFGLLASGTTANSSVQISSKDTAIFNGIAPLLFINGLRLPQAGAAGCVRRWGYYDTNNGFFFEDNAGVLRLVSRKAGVDTATSSGAFNGLLGASYTLDQNGHFFEIEMTGGRGVFMIDQVALHTLAAPAGTTSPIASLNLAIRLEITNTAAVNMTMEARGQNVSRLGGIDTRKLTEALTDLTDANLDRSVVVGRSGVDTYTTLVQKPPSTAAVATDIPLVVALHPSSPLPAGAAAIGSVSVSNFPATQPVSLATNTPDVTDRAARLLGVISAGANNIGSVNNRDGAGAALTSTTAGTKQGLDVNLVSSQSGLATTAATITAADVTTGGTVNTTGAVIANVAPAGNVTVSVTTSAFIGTVVFEVSDDAGVSFYPYQMTRDDGTGAETTFAINAASLLKRIWTNGVGGGITHFRVRASLFTSGTVAVRISPGVQLIDANPSLGAGSAVIGTVIQSSAPPATIGVASGNIGAPFYASGVAAFAAASVIASPGAGLSIYVTDMEASNEGAAGTAIVFSEGAATPVRYRRFIAASGGGFATNLRTAWKLPANTALWATVTAATTWNYTLNYYIAP